jgi:hypothetical protein
MRRVFYLLMITLLAATGCGRVHVETALTPDEQQAVTDGVRAFMHGVAHDVSKDGPTAWRAHFEDTPAFFMAVNGQLAFHDNRSAMEGIQTVAQTFKNIQLQWGDEIRVDPLTAKFAVVATSYHEALTTTNDQQLTSNGFFTAVAQNIGGQWQFRDVHWSVPAAAAPSATPGGS